MNKLIGMTDFVLEQYEEIQNSCVFETNCFNYAKFLKQPLELWQFVPCDEDGNVYKFGGETGHNAYDREYQKAKERCFFEGFELEFKNTVVSDDIQILFYKSEFSKFIELVEIFDEQMPNSIGKISTIEDLVKYEPLLTKTAIKQLSL